MVDIEQKKQKQLTIRIENDMYHARTHVHTYGPTLPPALVPR